VCFVFDLCRQFLRERPADAAAGSSHECPLCFVFVFQILLFPHKRGDQKRDHIGEDGEHEEAHEKTGEHFSTN